MIERNGLEPQLIAEESYVMSDEPLGNSDPEAAIKLSDQGIVVVS